MGGARGSIGHAGERNNSDGFKVRSHVTLYCCLGDNTQGTLASDDQTVQVVTSRGFSWSSLGLDDGAVGKTHGDVDDVFFHSTVTVRIGSGTRVSNTTSDLGTWTRIATEQQPVVVQVVVQVFPWNTTLHDHVEVFLVQLDNLVHVLGDVQNDTGARSRGHEVALERGPTGEWKDRNGVLVAYLE